MKSNFKKIMLLGIVALIGAIASSFFLTLSTPSIKQRVVTYSSVNAPAVSRAASPVSPTRTSSNPPKVKPQQLDTNKYVDPMKTYSEKASKKFVQTSSNTSDIHNLMTSGSKLNYNQNFNVNINFNMNLYFTHHNAGAWFLGGGLRLIFLKNGRAVKQNDLSLTYVYGGKKIPFPQHSSGFKVGMAGSNAPGKNWHWHNFKMEAKTSLNLQSLASTGFDSIKLEFHTFFAEYYHVVVFFGIDAINARIQSASGINILSMNNLKQQHRVDLQGRTWVSLVSSISKSTKNFYDPKTRFQKYYGNLHGYLSSLFTPHSNSTTQKDLKHHEGYWTEETNAPKFHFGLNNDIFSIYEGRKEQTRMLTKVKTMIHLDDQQKKKYKELIKAGKVNHTNQKEVLSLIKNRQDTQTLVLLPWKQYESNSYGRGYGKAAADWLETKPGNQQQQQKIDNYHFLGAYLKNSTFELKYINNNQHITKSNISLTDLIDYSITMINSDINNSTPQIIFESLKITKPKENSTPEVTEISILDGDQNFAKHYIDYKNNKYTAYFQPNALDIGNDVFFIPEGISTYKYDKDLIKKNNDGTPSTERAYKSIIYDLTIDGKIQQTPFILPTNGNYTDLTNWISTGPLSKTLKKILADAGQAFDKKKVTYVVNEIMTLTINPYHDSDTTTVPGTTILIGKTFSIVKVTDMFNGKLKILTDHTDGRLSNIFNEGFSITRNGNPTFAGRLAEGMHFVEAELKNYAHGDTTYRLLVDTKANTPTIGGASIVTQQKYYQEENGDFFKFFTSSSEIPVSFKERGIRNATISFVDSEGTWYSKKININNVIDGSKLLQEANSIIDYNGLFKMEYEDLAQNKEKFYLWIEHGLDGQVDTGRNIIARAQMTSSKSNKKIGSTGDVLWFNDSTGTKNVEVKNLLETKAIIKVFNKTTGLMEVVNNPSWLTETKQGGSSVGATINSGHNAHSLAGDELGKIIAGTGIISTPATSESRKYKELSLSITSGTYIEITITTSIFIKNRQGIMVSVPSTLKILNDNTYEIPSLIHTEDTTGLSLTLPTQEGTDKQAVISPTKQEINSLEDHGENNWRKVSRGFDTGIVRGFITDIKVEWSTLWYEWYEKEYSWNKNSKPDSSPIILDKEGKYKITYKDKLGIIHQLNYLVFTYPRNFEKYTTRKNVQEGDKIGIKTQTFYSSPAIATIQDTTSYEFTGSFISPGHSLPKWVNEGGLSTTATKYIYNFRKHFKADTMRDLKEELGSDMTLAPWITIDPNWKYTWTEDPDDPTKTIITRSWTVTSNGEHETTTPLGFIGPTSTEYKVSGVGIFDGTPKGVPPSITMTDLKRTHRLSISELMKTSYWNGKYIDLYKQRIIDGFKPLPSLLIDQDDDPDTPPVHQLEDYDHYMQSLNEWLANGGNLDGFYKSKAEHNGGGGGSKTKDKVAELHSSSTERPHGTIPPLLAWAGDGHPPTSYTFFDGRKHLGIPSVHEGLSIASWTDIHGVVHTGNPFVKITPSTTTNSGGNKSGIDPAILYGSIAGAIVFIVIAVWLVKSKKGTGFGKDKKKKSKKKVLKPNIKENIKENIKGKVKVPKPKVKKIKKTKTSKGGEHE